MQFVKASGPPRPSSRKTTRASSSSGWAAAPATWTSGTSSPATRPAANSSRSRPPPPASRSAKSCRPSPRSSRTSSLVRSLVTNEGSHERGTVLMNTGRQPNPVVQYPAIGAIGLVAADRQGPAAARLHRRRRHRPAHRARLPRHEVRSLHASRTPASRPQNIAAPGGLGGNDEETEERLRRRQRLFYTVEDDFAEGGFPHLDPEPSGRPSGRSRHARSAGSAAQAHAAIYKKGFDLTVRRSAPSSRSTRGPRRSSSCTAACRTASAWVACWPASWSRRASPPSRSTWAAGTTTATSSTPSSNGNGPRLDKGMGSLVKDLVDRGMWKNTVVLWMGEFGRTPRINQNNGRDHWARCWSVVTRRRRHQGRPGLRRHQQGRHGHSGRQAAARSATCSPRSSRAWASIPATQVRDNLGRPLAIADGKPLKGLV